MKQLIITLLLTWCLGLVACQPDAFSVVVEKPWIRAAPPSSQMMAAYGTVTNKGQDTLLLKSLSSPVFDEVSLHQTVEKEGRSRMITILDHELAPGQSLEMKPGSYHLMLMGPTGEIALGQRIPITFLYSDNHQHIVEFTVKKP